MLFDRFVLELFGQELMRLIVFCDDHETRSVFVESVDYPRAFGAAL